MATKRWALFLSTWTVRSLHIAVEPRIPGLWQPLASQHTGDARRPTLGAPHALETALATAFAVQGLSTSCCLCLPSRLVQAHRDDAWQGEQRDLARCRIRAWGLRASGCFSAHTKVLCAARPRACGASLHAGPAKPHRPHARAALRQLRSPAQPAATLPAWLPRSGCVQAGTRPRKSGPLGLALCAAGRGGCLCCTALEEGGLIPPRHL